MFCNIFINICHVFFKMKSKKTMLLHCSVSKDLYYIAQYIIMMTRLILFQSFSKGYYIIHAATYDCIVLTLTE